jgi:hypothetical protein
MHSSPRRLRAVLAVFPFFVPYLFHDIVGNIAWRVRPCFRRCASLQRRFENPSRNKITPSVRASSGRTWNDAGYGPVAITHEDFFSIPNHSEVSAKMRLQIADFNGSHDVIINECDQVGHVFICVSLLVEELRFGGNESVTSLQKFIQIQI